MLFMSLLYIHHAIILSCQCCFDLVFLNFREKMLVPIFTLKINHRVNPHMVTVGRYNGKHTALTCATAAGKVTLDITTKMVEIYTSYVVF